MSRILLRFRLGRRGAILAMFGIIFILSGLSMPDEPRILGQVLIHTYLPHAVRVAYWSLAGLVAVVSAVRPTGRDRVGFIALSVPLTIEVVSYLWSTIVYLITSAGVALGVGFQVEGSADAWGGAVEGAFYLAVLALVAGWPETTSVPSGGEQREA